MFELSDFNYFLPEELVAQFPKSRRDQSRLLCFKRSPQEIEHKIFRQLDEYLNKGDVLVLNNTKVMPARLLGRRATGGKVEVLILDLISDRRAHSLIKPLGRLKQGELIQLTKGFTCRLIDAQKKIVEFENISPSEVMQSIGLLPLPPYIRRTPIGLDKRTYQTVFAKQEGAVAAPTAGLHFTQSLLKRLAKKGVIIEYVTLHVGYGTFSPVRSEDIRQHKMHKEHYSIEATTLRQIRLAKRQRRRVVAVGTTVCRALEASAKKILAKGRLSRIEALTDIFIYPPYVFRVVDALLTNFHLPKTSLLMLVAAFTGKSLMDSVYREAIKEKYRFFSYGDAMFVY